MSLRPFGLLLVLLGTPTFASAQGAAAPLRGPAASAVFAPRVSGPLHNRSLISPDTARTGIGPTHWKEGALIGGLAGAVGGGLLGTAVCGQSDEVGNSCTGTTVLAALGGALLMAIPGALIGGQFPKGPRNAEPDAAE